MSKIKLMLGDNIESLKKLPDNSIDSIVSDPPYGLSFMGKKWDYEVPSVEFWREVYRVLKPGGHVLSFGGTRTYHRMAVNIEDAGFEIRDQIMWLYGSGFPKSHNIGKAVDKIQGNDREETGKGYVRNVKNEIGASGIKTGEYKETKGNSPWEGWGTALKPANEPICLARKPLSEKSVAANVLKWGTGGINIDVCRVGTDSIKINKLNSNKDLHHNYTEGFLGSSKIIPNENIEVGRFPANIILDEEAGMVLDEQTGILKSGAMNGVYKNSIMKNQPGVRDGKEVNLKQNASSGGASRFFYQSKVSKKERNMGLDNFDDKEKIGNLSDIVSDSKLKVKNNHPTVKPVSLMTYLVRLVTPPNGIVLDPFMGSGSTGIAARLEGFKFCGMEMDEDYFKIASERINNYEEYRQFIKNS